MASALLKAESWYGCYAGGRGDLFCPESNRHPAKMSVALCYRIFEYGRQRGYWKPGDVILDPMAGIGTTLVCGYSLGYNVIGVELEEHFVKLLGLNMLRCVAKIGAQGWFRIVQGDARRLTELLAGVDGAVTSPPYADQDLTGEGHFKSRFEPGQKSAKRNPREGYSGAVTSPPYSDASMPSCIRSSVRKLYREGKVADAVAAYKENQKRQVDLGQKYALDSNETILKRLAECAEREEGNYSGAITSPPYAESISSNKGTFDPAKFVKAGGPNSQANIPSRYSKGEGQIGNLRDPRGDIEKQLSVASCQLSAKQETYLSAMLRVYSELHAVLKPGGVVCLVTKNPVKAGAIRRLDEDTIRLMEAAGFALLERKMAMLTEELGEQGRLDGGTDKIRCERKSFFKRLFERKRPDLVVNHEDVLFFRKV